MGHLPGATYLAQLHLAGPSHLLPLVLFLLCQEDEQRRGVARAREASATSCFPLATSCFLLDAPETPRTSLPLSLTLPRPHPLPWTSLSLARTEPPPPTSSLAATATP